MGLDTILLHIYHYRGTGAFSATCLLWVICQLYGESLTFYKHSETSNSALQRSAACSNFREDFVLTAPFIFDSVYSLLKQWPSTYAPNGHSVVAATIPSNTPLYHAKSYSGLPKKPTFYAFDAEMSLGIYGSVGTHYLHTMKTTRPLSVIYFDGHSASPTGTGSMDAQTALLRWNVPLYPTDDFIYNETARALELCAFAKYLEIDGIVRMNAGFEVLVCDWVTSGLQEIHGVNITVPGNFAVENDPNLPRDPNRQPPHGIGNAFAEQNGWEWARSGAWHYGGHITGGGSLRERRVQIDLCKMVTFYDPSLRSLSGSHHGGIRGNDTYQNGWGLRRGHRILEINHQDVSTVRQWLWEAVQSSCTRKGFLSSSQRPLQPCSHIDWQLVTETIMDQHRSRGGEIFAVLHQKKDTELDLKNIVTKVHELSHAILYSYLEYPTIVNLSLNTIQEQTLARCASVYTEHIELSALGEFEIILKESIKLVLNKLCKWEWDLFEWSEHWTTDLLSGSNPDSLTNATDEQKEKLSHEINKYLETTRSVFKWIGWNTWYNCDKTCSWDEFCYIPMYPIVYSPGKHQGGIYAGSILTEKEVQDFWKPKCLSRTEFDRGGGRQRDPKHQLPDVPYYEFMAT